MNIKLKKISEQVIVVGEVGKFEDVQRIADEWRSGSANHSELDRSKVLLDRLR